MNIKSNQLNATQTFNRNSRPVTSAERAEYKAAKAIGKALERAEIVQNERYGQKMNGNAWELLNSIHAEISPKIADIQASDSFFYNAPEALPQAQPAFVSLDSLSDESPVSAIA